MAKKFTLEEDKLIQEYVDNYPNNIREGLSECTKKIPHRTLSSLVTRFYNHINKQVPASIILLLLVFITP